MSIDYSSELQAVCSGYDRKTCWVQTRAGVMPGGGAVITTQKLRLTGSDIFYAIHSMHSEDGGRTWSPPVEQAAFAPRPWQDGAYFYVSDFWPTWHAASGALLGTGHSPLYRNDELASGPYPRSTAYSVYDADAHAWRAWRFLELPEGAFYNSGSGCVQRLDLANGDILLPIYYRTEEASRDPWHHCSRVAVLRCTFDGETLRYVEHGNSLSVPEPRGLGEPSIARFADRFFLALRNDCCGFVAASDDGLHFGTPVPWRFDDGEDLGNYNTQQHWVTHADALFLVYTRRGAGNDHVFRHRAPLFMAEVDPERLCVIRDSERVIIPEDGARMGNFCTLNVDSDEAWVITGEWLQQLIDGYEDGMPFYANCARGDSPYNRIQYIGDLLLARIRF